MQKSLPTPQMIFFLEEIPRRELVKVKNSSKGLPWWLNGKVSTCNAGDLGSIPGSERSPRGGHGKPLQYFCLENPHGQRSRAGYSPRGPKELDTTEQLNTHMVCVCQSQPPNLSLLPFPPHNPKTVFYMCDSIFCK